MIAEIIFYTIFGLNVLCLILKRRSNLLTAASVCFAVVLYFLSDGAADYNAYYERYYGLNDLSVEIGYEYIMKGGALLHLSFIQFQGIVCTVCLFVLMLVFRKFSKNYQLFFALYFIYQYFYDLVIFRNHIAITIVSVALWLLLRKKRVMFVFWIVVATLFHNSSIFYLPLVFFNFNKRSHIVFMEWFAIVVTIICLVIFVIGRDSDLLLRIANRIPFIGSDKLVYFTSSVRLGFLPHYLLHIGNLFLNLAICGRWRMYALRSGDKYAQVGRFCYMINLYAMLSFPFIMYNITFFRLFNGLYLINFIYCAMSLDRLSSNRRKYRIALFEILMVNALYLLPFIHASGQKKVILSNISSKRRAL